jgi:hypothetical protein
VNDATASFPTWTGAKTIGLPVKKLPVLTPIKARAKEGERVVVEFRVKGGSIHPDGHVELFSETTWRHPQNLIVRFLKSELARFKAPNDQALLDLYQGKVVRVHGSVQTNPVQIGDLPLIEIGDPRQIEIVR